MGFGQMQDFSMVGSAIQGVDNISKSKAWFAKHG
jgi:hypothetical protein